MFKALEHRGDLADATTATALVIPVAFVMALALTWQAKRLLLGKSESSR